LIGGPGFNFPENGIYKLYNNLKIIQLGKNQLWAYVQPAIIVDETQVSMYLCYGSACIHNNIHAIYKHTIWIDHHDNLKTIHPHSSLKLSEENIRIWKSYSSASKAVEK
jgi:hypothetical protein